MTWVRFDDIYDDTEKVDGAWEDEPMTVGLHVQATTHCARHESDGVVSNRWLRRKLPATKTRTRVLDAMVKWRLFDLLTAGEIRELPAKRGPAITVGPLTEDHYLVHGYLEHNDSSAYLADRRARDAERKAAGGRNGSPVGIRTDSKRSPAGIRADSNGSRNGIHSDSESPDPTRPDPTASE